MSEDQSQEHEWSAFYDDEGRVYYYNSATGASAWDEPEKYNPAPPREEGEGEPAVVENEEGGNAETTQDVITDGKAGEAASGQDQSGGWVAYQDDEGREYYFNTETEETTWEEPADFVRDTSVEESAQPSTPTSPERIQSPTMEEEPTTPPMSTDEPPDESATENDMPEQECEPDEEKKEETIKEYVDPAVEAEKALNQTDGMMEPDIWSHVLEVVSSDGGKAGRAIQALSQNYYGTTAACGLLGRWLAELKSEAASSDIADPARRQAEQAKVFEKSADEIRDMATDVVSKISKERFTNEGGDAITKLKKNKIVFLEEMMDSPRWRKLLIDLSASNKDSAMLRYCLKSISKRGHHREIARRIDQSDHFAVFDAMLLSELAVVGKIAVSACQEKDTSIGLDELVGDLRRTCTSTAYTYIYALEVLRHLISVGKNLLKSIDCKESECFTRAVRKWERLSEDLQSSMIDPNTTGSTPLFRKRRLDVSAHISELHQRQRRRLMPDEGNGHFPNDSEHQAKIETSVLSFLRKYSLGTQIDDRTLDSMLPTGTGSSGLSINLVGELLVKRPLTIKALLGYLFKPGSQRVSSVVTKNKCARLLALATLAAEKEVCAEVNQTGGNASPEGDEVALTRMLIEGSKLCETLENMVSFVVTYETAKTKGTSPGEELIALAVKCPPVAQGVAIWAREVIKGSDFVSSGTYPTVSPSILSLVRVLYTEHPGIRDDALEVAFGFLCHSNSDSDISYQKLNEIKEQSLRLLLFLAVCGEAPTVLSRISKLLSQPGNSSLDASLVRYFVSGMLEIVQGPFSVPFVRTFATFLQAPGCVEAVRTSYFEDKSKKRLDIVIGEFKKLVENQKGGTALMQGDSLLVRSLVSTYSS